MAQTEVSVATNLREAILNITKYMRVDKRPRDYMKYVNEPHRIGHVLFARSLKHYIEITFSIFGNNDHHSNPLFQFDDILLSGSLAEGTFLFREDNKLSSDVDLMYVLRNIKITEEDQKKGNLVVKENTPFVNLYLTDEDLVKTCADCLETSCDASWERRAKLSSKKLKTRLQEKHPFYVFCKLMNVQDDIEVVNDGPSLPFSFGYNANPVKRYPACNYDVVLAIQCNGWPFCAQEWIFRPRCWPTQDLVQTIVKEGFHIVCKNSPEGDFRLSYSNAETLLIRNLSDLQFKTLRAFKSFVTHYKKDWSPNAKKAVCSYHLKTIFFWYCEKSDPMDWTEDRIVGHLLSLIDDLILALKEKNLPMYFMPKYNLMEQFEDTTEAVEQMRKLRLNINLITKAIITEERNTADAIKSKHTKTFEVIMNLLFWEVNLNPFLNFVGSGFNTLYAKITK